LKCSSIVLNHLAEFIFSIHFIYVGGDNAA